MIWLLALAVAFLGGMPGEATADQIITLTNANSAINPPFTGPYGTVDVHWVNSTTATIKLTANTVKIGGTNYIYMFGDGGTIGLNVNAASFTASNIVGSITQGGSGFQPWSLVGTGSGNEDGFGMFNFQANSFDGFAHVIDTLTLTLTNNSGTWGSASSVLTPNPGGSTAAAHIFVTVSPAVQSTGALATGYEANGRNGSVVVPEPSSVVLGFAALVGLGLTQIRRLVRRNSLALA